MSNENPAQDQLPQVVDHESEGPVPPLESPEVSDSLDFPRDVVEPRVTVVDEVVVKLSEASSHFIFGVATTVSEVLRTFEAMQSVEPTGSIQEKAAYEMAIAGATGDTHYSRDDLQAAVDNPNADWQQFVEHNGQRLRLAKPPTATATSETVSGSVATLLVEQLRGTGQTVTVPLPHTGIWVTLRSAKLSARVQLDQRLAMEKSKLGRLSRGYVFSNDSVITNEILLDFIMSHVIDCTIANWTPEILTSIIRIQDLPILAHAMACTMYPKGFPYAQACTVDPTKCVHVTRAKLNLTKMFWTDNNKLTPFQKARLAARRERVSPAVIETYHQNWIQFHSGVVALPSIRLVLKVPTLREHIDSGNQWISSVERMTEEALTNATPEIVQDRMITQGMATRLVSMAHWVARIELDVPSGDDISVKIIDDAETIRAVLADMSGDADDRETIIDGILKFINETTVALVAIPNYPCENCKRWQRTIDGPNSALIVFDPINTFFTLLQFKTLQDQEKNLI